MALIKKDNNIKNKKHSSFNKSMNELLNKCEIIKNLHNVLDVDDTTNINCNSFDELEKELERQIKRVKTCKREFCNNTRVVCGEFVFAGGFGGIQMILNILDYLDFESIFNLSKTGFFRILYLREKFTTQEIEKIKDKYIEKLKIYVSKKRGIFNKLSSKLKIKFAAYSYKNISWYGFIFEREKYTIKYGKKDFQKIYMKYYGKNFQKIYIKYLYLCNNELKSNLNKHVLNDNTCTIMNWAVKNNNLNMVKYLNKYGADLRICDNFMNSNIMISILNKSYDVTKYLLNQNIAYTSIKTQNNNNLNILHFALISKIDIETFKRILDMILSYNENILQEINYLKFNNKPIRMTILDFAELKNPHKFVNNDMFVNTDDHKDLYLKYLYKFIDGVMLKKSSVYDELICDPYKIALLESKGAVRNIFKSIEVNDFISLNFWIKKIKEEDRKPLLGNVVEVGDTENFINEMQYDTIKVLNKLKLYSPYTKIYCKINPLDFSYILGRVKISEILKKKGFKINYSGLLAIIKSKDIDLVKYYMDELDIDNSMDDIIPRIYDFETIDEKTEEILKILIDKGFLINRDEKHLNFAFKAVLHEDLDKLKELLEDKIYSDFNDDKIVKFRKYIEDYRRKYDLLLYAVKYNRKSLEMIKYLVQVDDGFLLKYTYIDYGTMARSKSINNLNALNKKKILSLRNLYKNKQYKDLTNSIINFFASLDKKS
jgi:hypothetical protein